MLPNRTCRNRARRPWKRGESRMLWWCRCSRMQLKPTRTFPEAPGQHGSNINYVLFLFSEKEGLVLLICWTITDTFVWCINDVSVVWDNVSVTAWYCSWNHLSLFIIVRVMNKVWSRLRGKRDKLKYIHFLFVNSKRFELSGVLTVHKVKRNLKGLWCHGILNHLWWCRRVCNHVCPAITSQVKWRHEISKIFVKILMTAEISRFHFLQDKKKEKLNFI